MTAPTGSDGESLAAPKWNAEGELVFMPGSFRDTDLGNAERLVAMHRESIRYSAERRMWLIWNGQHWQWDKQKLIGRRAKATVRGIIQEALAVDNPDRRAQLLKWAIKSESNRGVAAMVELARSEEGVPVLVSECDRDPWLLNCVNGTLDLRTSTLRPHDRNDLITRTTGVTYDPAASSVLWLKVLHNATQGDEELHRYLRRIAGYALTGLATEKKFFFFCGAPDSGKSTLIVGLHACLGSYARSTDFDTWLARPQVGGNRNDLVALQGARLVTSVEVSKKAKWDTALLKRITGGDPITAMAKYEDEVCFIPCCTIIMAANDSPKARDDDPGFWKRCQRIPFDAPLASADQIKGLGDKLREPEHAAAILAWAVEGCADWQKEGIGTAQKVEESTEAYRAENDWIGGFLEQFEIDPDALLPAKIFRDRYEAYCKQEGQFTESTKELAKQLEARDPRIRYVKVHGERQWRGLKLKGEMRQQDMPGEERWG